jgi:type IV pilus assembly protein PilZ
LLFGKKTDRYGKRSKTDRDSLDEDSLFPDSSLEGDSQTLGDGLDEVTVQVPAPGRPKVMSVTIKDRKTLHAAYMPFLNSGGVFVPSKGKYKMGDEVFLLLNLVGSNENLSVPGKVVWITPAGAMSSRVEGIGIQFTGPEAGKVKTRIEGILGGTLNSRRMTHTM